VFDPESWDEYRKIEPDIDDMVEDIFYSVFIGCLPEAEDDARARLGRPRP